VGDERPSLIVNNVIRIEQAELTSRQWKKLYRSLTFVNPNGEVVTCYRQLLTRGYTKIPRGAWNLLPDSVRYVDKRSCPKGKSFEFHLRLDDLEKDERFKGQGEAVAAMFENEQGLIIRPPGTGKTQIALAFAAAVGTPTLVLVHTEDILQQWVSYALEAIPGARVGVIRGKQIEIGDVTIATVQTIKKFIGDKAFWKQFGCVILDEAHHASAATFEAVLNQCPAKYRFGFTASPTRADGMHPTMKFIIGPIIHSQPFTSPVDLKVIRVKTKFYYGYRGRFDWMPMLNKLVRSKKRNQLIASKADKEIARGNSVLILSRRIEHLEHLAKRIKSPTEILTAATRTKKERASVLAGFKTGEIRVVLATQLADEALDVPRLNRIMLVFPGKHEGRIIQQIGRALRKHPDKKNAVIYDFVDWRVKILRRQGSQRLRTYRQNKIKIQKRRVRI
jgi:superfamily II DNA or RNA helicase